MTRSRSTALGVALVLLSLGRASRHSGSRSARKTEPPAPRPGEACPGRPPAPEAAPKADAKPTARPGPKVSDRAEDALG